MAVKIVWNPNASGLSVSALNLWLINRVAFELSYFQDLEPVEPWNKNTAYGSLIGAGLEGYIKTREGRGISRFIELQFKKDITKFNEYDEISWWTELAEFQARLFVDIYKDDFDKYDITSAEVKRKVTVPLPSGRSITLSGYFDGEGGSTIFEHKCRAEWNTERIANEIDLDLQYNFYLLLYWACYGVLPTNVWYQHSRRPGGFAYRGPKQKTLETKKDYLKRLQEYMLENKEDHFYQFISTPTEDRFNRFMHICLYPILEAFLDWYEYMITPNRKAAVNRHHWMTPYGLYNPYLEGTDERFRDYALTGTSVGLKRKVRFNAPTN
jgi:hypothetical protein